MADRGGGEPSVADLVVHAQAGSVEARARLIAHYYQPLRAFLRRQTGDSALADDLAHDTLLYVLTHLDTLDKPERFRGWLFRIAARQVLMEQRRRRRERERTVPLDVTDMAADIPAPTPSPTDEVVRHVLARLSPALREALEGRGLHGEEIPRLARRVGRSVAALRKNVTRAKARFALLYAKEQEQQRGQENDGDDGGRPTP